MIGLGIGLLVQRLNRAEVQEPESIEGEGETAPGAEGDDE